MTMKLKFLLTSASLVASVLFLVFVTSLSAQNAPKPVQSAPKLAQNAPNPAPSAPQPTKSDVATFDVIGISVRTSNAAETGGNGQIPQLWQRLFTEGILSAISDRADDAIVAVYTNYAGDQNGDYTYILGSKVKSGTKAPDGMTAVTVPSGKYLDFVTDKGPGGEIVPKAWTEIAGYFQAPASPKRTFKTDFERYDDMSDPNAMQGHIFIGVK